MFTCMQKIKFIAAFLLEILQKSCTTVILGTLGISGNGHQKHWYQLAGNVDVYIHVKKSNLSFASFLRYCYVAKIYCKFGILGTLDMHGYTHQKRVSTLTRLWCLSTSKKNNFFPNFFLDILYFLNKSLEYSWPRAFWSITLKADLFWQIKVCGEIWNETPF